MSKKRLKNICSEADHAILRERYEFIPSEKKVSSWQDRMVQNYNEGLYKEFALADLSRPGKLGLRWRTRQEVEAARGERTCGNKICHSDAVCTLEVPFTYEERGIQKKELVKLRLCPRCKPLVETKTSNREKEHRRRDSLSDSDSDEESLFDDESEYSHRKSKRSKRNKRKKKKRRKKYKSDSDSDSEAEYTKRKKRHKRDKR